MTDERRVEWVGPSKRDLLKFPQKVRYAIGYQLEQLELGLQPDDWKSMPTVGPGAGEIRVSSGGNAYRVFYVAKFGDVVYVLHCFVKKTRKTEHKDIKIGAKRYAEARADFERRQRGGD